MLKRYKNLPWPQNLWSAVFRKQVSADELPEDWEQALEHVLDSLRSEKKKEILKFYFRDGRTLQEIGDFYGTTAEPVRQHAEKALRSIRHPSRKIFLFIGLENGKAALSKEREVEPRRLDDDKTIDSIGLSVRAWNCLRRARIETIEQLTQHTEWELSKLRNMGAKTLQEIKDCLAARGLSLRTEEDR